MTQNTTDNNSGRTRLRLGYLLLLVFAISAVFVKMLWGFLMALVLAAICSGLMYPLYKRLLRRFKERQSLATMVTILVFLLALIVPLSAFMGVVASQAIELTEGVTPWIEEQVGDTNKINALLQRVPYADRLVPYTDDILAKGGVLAGQIGEYVVGSVANIASGTINFFFMLFIMLYSMFFFLKDGPKVLEKIFYYSPLSTADEERLMGKFVSVTRATLKGSLIIGIVQGALAGASFAVAGIPGWALWGTVMAVLSMLPGIGSALVWIPAVIYLLIIGDYVAFIGVFLWCALFVGTIDNVLRPRLVGRDTEMPDLLILLGTLGGVALFGAVGIIIGPIVTALFLTIWEIYGVAFKDYLEDPSPVLATDGSELPVSADETADLS